MGTHYRAEAAVLKPSCVHFRIDAVSEVASDVVAPVSVEDIRCCRGEIWLEFKRFPCDGSVSGETDLVAVVSESAPAMVKKRTLVAVALHVAEVAVVDPPCVVQPGHLLVKDMLLPVEPPEIHTFLLHRMHDLVEHVGHELLVGVGPFYPACVGRIHSEALREGRVALFPMVESVRRVEVQSHLQAFILQVIHEFARIREDALVPCPSCPPATAFVGVMPVHVDDEYIKRNVICVELVNQCAHFPVGVCPVAAPPVSESETWGQRHLAGKDSEILERGLVIVAVSHEIPVLAFLVLPFLHPCPFGIIEKEVLRFINQGPSVTCEDTILELSGLALLHVLYPCLGLVVSVKSVKSTESTLEVLLLLNARLPCEETVICLYGKVACGERSASGPVRKGHPGGLDL